MNNTLSSSSRSSPILNTNGRIPTLGWVYRYFCTSIFGIAALNTGGFLRFDDSLKDTVAKFDCDAVLVRADVTIAVSGNTNGAFAGAAVIKNPTPNTDWAGARNVVLLNLTTAETAIITKTLHLTPYTGVSLQCGDFIGLGVIGDNTALVNVGWNLMYAANPGNIVNRS